MITTFQIHRLIHQFLTGAVHGPFLRTASIPIVILFANPARADLDEKLKISMGTSIATYNTELLIRTQNGSIDKEIDLEDDLDFDQQVRTGWLRLSYRMASRHRLRLTYTPVRRSSEKVTAKDLYIEDYIIKAGASVESSFKSEIYDIDYVYSFYKRPHAELGLSGGLYWFTTSSNINANGEIVLEGNETEVRPTYETKQKLNAPLPLLGVSATYELSNHWNIHGAARYLYVSVNDITGRITSASVAADYYFSKNWGIGLTLSTFALDVRKEGIVFDNSLSWTHNGVQFYIVYEK